MYACIYLYMEGSVECIENVFDTLYGTILILLYVFWQDCLSALVCLWRWVLKGLANILG